MSSLHTFVFISLIFLNTQYTYISPPQHHHLFFAEISWNTCACHYIIPYVLRSCLMLHLWPALFLSLSRSCLTLFTRFISVPRLYLMSCLTSHPAVQTEVAASIHFPLSEPLCHYCWMWAIISQDNHIQLPGCLCRLSNAYCPFFSIHNDG